MQDFVLLFFLWWADAVFPSSSSSQKEIFGITLCGKNLMAIRVEEGLFGEESKKNYQVTSLPGHARAQRLEGLVRFPYRFRFEDG